jgi:D-alanine-D-alanine ligase
MKKRIAIIHEELRENGTADEQDTLVQVRCIDTTLQKLGFATVLLPVSLDLSCLQSTLAKLQPFLVFNLVESLAGATRYLHFIPALLEASGAAFTGSGESALYLTTNKPLAKKFMKHAGIPTPDWQEFATVATDNITIPVPFILKPSGDDASRDITDTSVVHTEDQLFNLLNQSRTIRKADFFIESYIPGREISISLLADSGRRPEVLPPSEIVFEGFPDNKPRIVNYDAKWAPHSFEYNHTPRTFTFAHEDQSMLETCRNIACRCWEYFGMKGYGRVDFRIDDRNRPWVIDVNANPCLAPDSGFIATARNAGYTYEGIITRILDGVSFHSLRLRETGVF